MTSNDQKKEGVAFSIGAFGLSAAFFLGLAILDGPVWCVDSPSYTEMTFVREPLYPLFLWCLLMICEKTGFTGLMYGQERYLFVAVIIQSIIWVIATYALGRFVYRNALKSLSGKRAITLGFIAVLSQIAVAAINRFVAGRGSMYSESIMTESIAMPLFILFNITLIESFIDYDKNAFIRLAIMGFLIASVRKQMLITLIIWGGCAFVLYLFVKRHRSVKKFLLVLLAILISFAAINLMDRTYNYAVRGVFAGHVGDSKGGLNTVLYTALPEDRELFSPLEDEYPGITGLYDEIYEECIEQGLTIDSAQGYELKEKSTVFNSDWTAMVEHYAQAYDIIGFDVVLPAGDRYVARQFPELDEVHAQIMENRVEKVLFRTLLKEAFHKITSGQDRGIAYVFWGNVLKAFVISNANMYPKVLIPVSLIMYVIFLALMVWTGIRNLRGRGIPEGRRTFGRFVLIMGFVVMAGIAVNCFVTGSMIFPQGRYMCYSMGLFYLTLSCAILC